MKNYILTKTKITSGLQCQKRLWFDCHDPIKKDNFLFHLGNRFGEVVRKYYGKGVDLSNNIYDINLALSDTTKAIKDEKVNVIYEGAFIYSDTLVRADVLLRNKDGWELLEAKSSTKLKDEHIDDVAIQSYIIKSSGIKISSVKLIHIDNEFTYEGDGNYDDLIEVEDITKDILFKEKTIQSYIEQFKPIADKNYPNPQIETGEHCLKPYKCIYLPRCNNLKPHSKKTLISILPRISKKLVQEYKNRGITNLEDIPSVELNESQRIIQSAHKDNEPYINPKLDKIIKEFKWPLYFMDFETINQGVPIIKGTQAYYALPFQWSVHKWDSQTDKINDGMSFLDFSDQNIERKFIESLLDAVGSKGTVFAHNASTEINVIKKLKDKDSCKDLSEKIDNLIARVVDTLTIVKNNFYSPIMNGDYDLKTIIKAIPSDVSYEEKDNIAGGNEAQLAWFIYTDPKTSNDDKEKQIKLLKAYCAKDTLAIYYLIKHLLEQSKVIEKINK
jgi:hypothetical protein